MLNLKKETHRKEQQVELKHLLISAINMDNEVKRKGMHKGNGIQKPTRAFEANYCGHIINYIVNNNKTHKRGHGGLYCHEKLCVICGKIYALKMRIELTTLINYLNRHYQYKNGQPKYSLIFLTVSVPNSKNNYKDFKRVHKQLNRNFNRMLRYKHFDGFTKRNHKAKKGIIQGAVGKIEETYNQKLNSWNLHLHSLLIVHRSYYHSKYYTPFKTWRSKWEKANKWNPIAHNGKHLQLCIERPFYKDKYGKRHTINEASTPKEKSLARHSESCELTAYETKSVDFKKILRTKSNLSLKQKQHLQQHTFNTAYFGLKHQRTYNFIGLFKKLNKLYKNGKLDKYKPKDKYTYKYYWSTQFNSKESKYKTTKFRELTKNEMSKLENRGLKTTLNIETTKPDLKTCGPIVYADWKFRHVNDENPISVYKYKLNKNENSLIKDCG